MDNRRSLFHLNIEVNIKTKKLIKLKKPNHEKKMIKPIKI
jgi:hypothetical protein